MASSMVIDPSELRPGTTLAVDHRPPHRQWLLCRRQSASLFRGADELLRVEASTKLHHLSDGRSIVVVAASDAIRRLADDACGRLGDPADRGASRLSRASRSADRPRQSAALRREIARGARSARRNAAKALQSCSSTSIASRRSTTRSAIRAAMLCSSPSRSGCAAASPIPISWRDWAATNSPSCKCGRAGRDTTLHVASAAARDGGAAYELDGQKVMIGASIGIATAPDNGSRRRSAHAQRRSRSLSIEGRGPQLLPLLRPQHGCECQSPPFARDRFAQFHHERGFPARISAVFDVERQRVCAAEALVRWRHPSGDVIEPAKFIGIAEETGLIVPLGEWILRQACSDALAWPEDSRSLRQSFGGAIHPWQYLRDRRSRVAGDRTAAGAARTRSHGIDFPAQQRAPRSGSCVGSRSLASRSPSTISEPAIRR